MILNIALRIDVKLRKNKILNADIRIWIPIYHS